MSKRIFKVSDRFVLRNIAGDDLLIPIGQAAMDVSGLIALSESGALLYGKLREGSSMEDLIAALTEEYEVSKEEAARDIEAFLNRMRELNMLLEECV